MMRSAFGRFVPFAMLLLLVGACSNNNNNDSNGTPSPTGPSPTPSPSTCSTTATGVPGQVTSRGGSFTFNLTSAGNCTWTARTDVQWANVNPGSGTGNGTLVLQVLETTQNDSRTLNISINTQSYRVVQEGVRCVYTLNIPTTDVGNDGGTAEMGLTTPTGCSWTVTSNEGWITVLTPSGSGSGPIRLGIAKNTGPLRQAIVTIAGQQITFTQARG
jgi:BACON domain-containing protein